MALAVLLATTAAGCSLIYDRAVASGDGGTSDAVAGADGAEPDAAPPPMVHRS